MRKLLVLAIMLVLSGNAEAAQRHCMGRDLAADAKGRIYQDRRDTVHACLRIRDRPVRIARAAVTLPRVTSPYAAAATAARVRVIDMRNGTQRSAAGRATDLVLTGHGVAVFIAGGHVLRLDGTDLGAGDAGSLALSIDEERVYWLNDGVPQTAPLAPVARAARSCPTFGRLDIRADARGRIYQNNSYQLFACVRSSGKQREFSASGDEYYWPVVNSPFAAIVALGYSPYGNGSHELEVLDMRDGRSTSTYVSGGVSELVLSNHGVATYIAGSPVDIDGQPTGQPSVQRMARGGKVTELDAGNVDGLAQSPDGRHVFWLKDGAARVG